MKAKVIFLALRVALLTILVWAASLTPTLAGGVVTNCSNDAQFSSLLAGGGTVTFNCSTALIHLSSTKTISVNTTIDGEGKITLSGDNARRLFVVSSGVTLTLNNITLSNGYTASGNGGAIYNGSFGGDGGTLIINNSQLLNNTLGSSGFLPHLRQYSV